MEINCLSCGHKVDIGDAYDDFEGAIKCFVCGGFLRIRTEQGQVKSVKLAGAQEFAPPSESETEDKARTL
jgi:hypothetical protein